MAKMKFIFLFTAVILASVNADGINPEPPHTQTPTDPPSTTSSTTSTTTKSTTTVSTTTTSPTTATPKTTVTPDTTTTTGTTSKTTTMTTTIAPVTTTTMKPAPKPEALNFNVTDTVKNITCILLHMEGVFHVPYNTTNGTKEAKVIIPKESVANGKCGDDQQVITISWSYNNKNMDNLTMTFEKNTTSKKFMISSVEGAIFKFDHEFLNATDNATVTFKHKHADFVTPLSMSYKCKKAEYLNLTMDGTKAISQFVVSDLQVQAFRNTTAAKFSTAEDCEPFETSGIVPIAVGCSLAVLIIIVLVAYLIGRRHSQARGYLSM